MRRLPRKDRARPAHQIIKQTHGRYAIFSAETQTIIVWDATAQEIYDWFIKLAAQETRRHVYDVITAVDAGTAEDVYGRDGAMTWEEALRIDRKHGGEASADLVNEIQSLANLSDEQKAVLIAELRKRGL